MANRFNKYHKMFANFTGTDILRLSRSDLIEMCGIADGLRLFYALHAKWVKFHAIVHDAVICINVALGYFLED